MTTGQRIKAARKTAGITQAELASRIGVPFQSISQWERDKRNPKMSTLRLIANALSIPVYELAGNDDEFFQALYSGQVTLEQISEEMNIPTEKVWAVVLNDISSVPNEYKEEFEVIRAKVFAVGALLAEELSSPEYQELQKQHEELSYYFNSLSDEGRIIAIERIKELSEIPKYQRVYTFKEKIVSDSE